MARDGSGNMSVPYPNFVSGQTISSTQVNANFSTLSDEITNSMPRDGQAAPTANLPMGGFKLTGMGAGSAATDSATLGQVQALAFLSGGTAGGTADALTISPSPAITAYALGQTFRFTASATNTGAATIAVSGLTSKAIQNEGSALSAGNIASGKLYEVIYDGTQFQIRSVKLGGTGDMSGANNLSDVANAATARTNLGAVGAAAADISGTMALSGDISPTQITANQDDYNPTGLSGASTLRLSTDASRDITGLAGGADGRIILIHNVGSNNIVLKDESASSTAANRFALSADITLAADQSAALQYDSTSSRWRCLASPSLAVSSATTPLGSVSVTNAATLSIDWTNNSYDKVLVVVNAKPVTDNTAMRFRLRQSATDVSSAGAYRTGAASDTYAYLAGDTGIGSDTNEWGIFASYQIATPGAATSYKAVQSDENWVNASSGNPSKTTTTWGFMANASAVTGMTIYAASGNVTGTISAIGFKGATS